MLFLLKEEMNRNEKPPAANPGAQRKEDTNRRQGVRTDILLGSRNLTKKLYVCQLESFQAGTIVGRIESYPNDQQGAIVRISNTLVIVGGIGVGIKFLPDDEFGVNVHMIQFVMLSPSL